MKTSKVVGLVCGLLVAGCATTVNIERVAAATKEAVTLGTEVALIEHPEWRTSFYEVSAGLRLLAEADKITLDGILSSLNKLPVSELSSDKARLIISGARLVIAVSGWSDTEIVQTEQLRPIALAIADGIDAGSVVRKVSAAARITTIKTKGHYKAK